VLKDDQRRITKRKDNDYIGNMIKRDFELKVIDNSRSTSPIIRDSLSIPLMMGQPDPQRNTLWDYQNMRYKDYG
jgi:hypothetical protein